MSDPLDDLRAAAGAVITAYDEGGIVAMTPAIDALRAAWLRDLQHQLDTSTAALNKAVADNQPMPPTDPTPPADQREG